MSRLKEKIKSITPDFIVEAKRNILRQHEGVGKYRFTGNSVEHDIRGKYACPNDLLSIYCEGSGKLVQKWHHYIPLYERYFREFRGSKVRFLEIGVSKGGSLAMWRKYFGDEAIIYGIDIDPSCKSFNGIDAQVRIGSQADQKFLEDVISEMGGVDLVLDDGSHEMPHIRKSLEVIFPHLSNGGIYMIEDLHTSYWPAFGGGLRSKDNFFRYLLGLIDDMHRWYHSGNVNFPELTDHLSAVHIHDSVVVLEKNKVYPPTFSEIV